MQNNACRKHTSSNTSTVAGLLSSLTVEDHQNLHTFAERRLQRLRVYPGTARLLASWSADDLIHAVITKFLLGELDPENGRHLSERHRQNTTVFLRALMGAVNSELNNLLTCAETATAHVTADGPAGDVAAVELVSPDDMSHQLERRDLNRMLFRRLDEVAGPAQVEIVRAMESGALMDTEPSLESFDRRRVHEVRQMARRILSELEADVSPGSPRFDLSP